MMETVSLQAPVYATHYANRKVIEYPVSGKVALNEGRKFSSYTMIPKNFTNVTHTTEDPWNPEKYGALWAIETSVVWYKLSPYSSRIPNQVLVDHTWAPFAWATELEDACTITRYARPKSEFRIVHVLTGEEIPLHVL